jgi:putative hydrolase of HD superfamily
MDYLCNRLLGKVHGGVNGEEIRRVWQEYEDSETDESRFVHDIDKIELLHQMVEYEKHHGGRIDLGEFARVARNIQLPEVKSWWEEIMSDREQYWRSIGHEKAPAYAQGSVDKQHDEYYGKNK